MADHAVLSWLNFGEEPGEGKSSTTQLCPGKNFWKELEEMRSERVEQHASDKVKT